MRRRDFIRASGWAVAGSWMGASLLRTAHGGGTPVVTGPGPYGPLSATPDANGILLPAGFQSRVLAEAAVPVGSTGYTWHGFPDGGATFPVQGGWVYVSNSEIPLGGGVGALRFDADGNIIDAYSILSGSNTNCAGGPTLWGTWLSCEEWPTGIVWECDPLGGPAQARPAMGSFNHEAVLQDPNDPMRFYLTEDRSDGGFYRFTPDSLGDLSSGVLEIAEVVGPGPNGSVVWHVVPDPDRDVDSTRTRLQVPQATSFDGGEGIVWARGLVFFTTKGDNRVWAYDPVAEDVCIHYDFATDPGQQLSGVDNIASSRFGDLYVAEDGGNMEIVVLSPEGTASPLLRILNQDNSEIAGPAFDPLHRRLYFSSQRGGALSAGITYEVTGPFRDGMGCIA